MSEYCPINCKWLNATEEEQNRLQQDKRIMVHHVCLKYEEQLYHLSAHPKLYKCEQCLKEK